MILYCVSDRRRIGLSIAALVERLRWLGEAGVDYIQIRERDLSDKDVFDLTRAVVAATARTPSRVLVNDRADIAVAAGAAGVHLREDSPAAARVRAIVPRPFVVGRSVHDMAGVRRENADGACDLLLFGTVFPSRGKPPEHVVSGVGMLRDICSASRLPVVAIGGIDDERAESVGRAGASGIAAVDVLLGAASAADARERVARLRRRFDSGSAVV